MRSGPSQNSSLMFRDGALVRQPSVFDLPRPLVFTNGVFDILHRGHTEYLGDARKLGASLLVAINSDDSVRGLAKGAERPINSEYDRCLVVSSLRCVSAVVIFDEQTPIRVIKSIKPDIYVKGGDYDIELLPETAIVRSWGGLALTIPFRSGYSTTALIKKISG